MWIFFSIGLLMILAGALFFGYENRAVSWPRVPAEVLRSEQVSAPSGSTGGEVEVKFSDGSKRVLSLGYSSDSATIENDLAAYPVGATVMLPQNPNDPTDVRLPPSGSLLVALVLGGGGFLFILIPIGVVALDQRNDALRLVGWLFLGIGGVALCFCVYLGATRVEVLRGWPKATVTVTEAKLGARSGRRGNLQAVDLKIRFEASGQTVETVWIHRTTVTQAEALLQGALAPGTEHVLHYDPSRPELVQQAEWSFRYFLAPLAAALFAMIFGGLGALVVKFLAPAHRS